jgi:hypothetical protein
MMTCGPGIRIEATVSTRTSVTDQPKRWAMPAHTPAIIVPDEGRTSLLMPQVWQTEVARTSGLTPGCPYFVAAGVFAFFVNSVCASSSDRPFVSGTILKTNTKETAANSAYMP